MAEATLTARVVRFGVFEADLRAGELRKNGLKIKLQEQPFQILAMLLARPGEVVTREEVQKKLWKDDTFVDFDKGLNTAINKIREALSESADNPRFVETLPRRGYRFIAPVEGMERGTESSPHTSQPAGRDAEPRITMPSRRSLYLSLGALALVGLVAVGINVGGIRDKLAGGPAPGEIRSLAVLPLKNLMGDSEQDYFVEGMHEAIITELSKIRALKVISRTSAMRFKNTDKSVPVIARELGVDAVIEGSVLRAGDRVRVTAQLIHGATDEHEWAGNFDRDLVDVLTLSTEVARAIAEEIKIAVTLEEETRLASARPVNPEAHEAYLRGRYFWNRRTEDGLKRGLEYFQNAIEIDPEFSLAYSGLADSYAMLAVFGYMTGDEGYPKAKEAITKALELDDNLAEGHASLAYVNFRYDLDWLSAEREFKRALELNPNYSTAHHWYSTYLTTMGRTGEAVAEEKIALELDPFSIRINVRLGSRYRSNRQWDQAIAQSRKTLELRPNHPVSHHGLAMAYQGKEMYEEALAELEKWKSLGGGGRGHYEADVAVIYARMQKTGEALEILEDLKQRRAKGEDVIVINFAFVYAALGNKDETFVWLDTAYKENRRSLVTLKSSRAFDLLRDDPRFQDLLRRMNFPP